MFKGQPLSRQEQKRGGDVGDACDPPEDKFFIIVADPCRSVPAQACVQKAAVDMQGI